MSDRAKRTAFVLGASGAVGRRLVEALTASAAFSRIVLFGRRTIPGLPENIEQVIVDFDKVEEEADKFKNLDVGFCALGTTRSKSGAEGFYKVDHDYIVNTAKIAREQGTTEFCLVSSGGSNENSSFLYMKTKGETERDVGKLGFDKLLIARPGFLEGPREEFRLAECLAKVFLSPLTLISNKIAISTADVAKALVVGAQDDALSGNVIWDNAELLKRARSFKINSSRSTET